ncbi:MAG: hypothetical protein ACI4ED_02345 [Suilimivivens sp.]
MKKVIYYSGILMTSVILLSGCSNEIPDMNEEERSMVVNYAADIVQKYDSNHPVKLQTLTPLPEENFSDQTENELEMEESVPKNQAADIGQETASVDKVVLETDVIDNTVVNSEMTLDSFLQLDPFSFSYVGYELDDSYPVSGTESYFAMNASEGNKLLVFKFLANNRSETEEILEMFQTGVRFKIQINGETKNALTTMLLNDFANYQGVVEAGEGVELVIICEIPAEQTLDTGSLALIVKNADETATISLR